MGIHVFSFVEEHIQNVGSKSLFLRPVAPTYESQMLVVRALRVLVKHSGRAVEVKASSCNGTTLSSPIAFHASVGLWRVNKPL